MNQGGSGRPGFFFFFFSLGGTRPQALLYLRHYVTVTLLQQLSPPPGWARPQALLYLRHYVALTVTLLQQCDTMSHCYVSYLLDTKCRAWFLIRNISVMVYPLSKKGTINFLQSRSSFFSFLVAFFFFIFISPFIL